MPEGVDTILMLSGDSHHYAHYTNIDDEGHARAKVTAGGGGAFLSATHTLPDRVDVPKAMLGEEDPPHALERFDLVTTYPSKPQSRRLTYGAFLVGWRNPTFLIIPAILNLLLFAANTAGLRPDVGCDRGRRSRLELRRLADGPFPRRVLGRARAHSVALARRVLQGQEDDAGGGWH